MDMCKVGARVMCTGCSQQYTTRDGSYGRAGRRPLLLACGHTLCESCLLCALSGGKDSIVCSICSDASTRKHKDANIYADFPLNMFVLGAVAARQWTQSTGDSRVTFAPPGASTRRYNKGRVAEVSPTHQPVPDVCEECVSRPCDWFCQHCELKYCNTCFSKVHKAKALMKHVKVPPPVGNVKLLETQLCHTHKDKPLEFHCKQCDTSICAHCFVDSHRPHDVVSLLEKNKDCLESLQEGYEKGSKMLKQLLSTHKKVESMRQASGKQQVASTAPYARVELEVVHHFSLLHGVLQHAEKQLLTQLWEARARHVDSLHDISGELAEHLLHVREVLDSARVAMLPANLGVVDASTVQEKLQLITDLPCHLVTTVTGDSNAIEFIVEDSFLEKLASHCRLELESSVHHALLKADELPADYVVDPVDESLPDGVCPPLTCSSRTSSVSALGEDAAVTTEQQQLQKTPPVVSANGRVMQFAFHERQDNTGPNNTHPVINIALDPASRKKARNILKGTSEAVIVTHIKDPGDFYVQLQSDQQKISSLAVTYKKLAVSSSTPTHVKPGGIYLVQYKEDKNWYRGRAVCVLPVCNAQAEQLVLVQYIDFGNSEKVAFSSLRVAPKSCLQTPFLAIHCGLHGIHPTGDKWSPESVKLFAQMVNSSVAMMVVLGHTADKYEVDLCRMPNGGDDVPSSVQDAVVFLGFAHYFQNVPRTDRQILAKPNPFYNDKGGLKHGDIVDVTISHVENPVSFYVQKVDQSYLMMNDMMEKLGEEYSAVGKRRLVYTPYLNMPCAALYSLDKKWYRAKVVDVPGNRLVKVEYVDFGNKELVSWNKIRKLSDAYMQLPAQAIHCALNDVVPPPETGNKWTAKASNFLQQRTVSQITRMFVDAATADVLKVTLYEVKPNVDICINALMVREGLAKSTGVSSSLVEFHKSVDDDRNMKLKLPPMAKSGVDKKRLLKSHAVPVQEPQLDNTDEGDDAITEDMEEGPLKVEVTVLSVLNPSHMYVSIVSQQQLLTSMMEEMQQFYQQCPNSDKEWAVGDYCAAYDKDKKLWYRGTIVELPDTENAKIFLKDTGNCETVEVLYLRELSNLFTQLHDGAVRCHLAGIKPAGSTSSWSILATEFLTTLVSQDNVFSITKKGEMEGGSLPVELLMKEVVEEGPLTPTVEEWRTITNKLIEQGLAFAVRDDSTSSSLSGGKQLLKTLEKNSDTEGISVSRWLKTQKCTRSSGPRKSPIKLLTSTSADDRSAVVIENIVEPGGQNTGKNASLSDSMVTHASGAESDDASDVPQECSLPPLFESWLPPNPLSSLELWIVPTYVDMKCTIYFHDHMQEDTLTVIGNGLNSRFCNSKPKPYDSYWSPGQTCVAQFHSDKKWYRAQVMAIKEDMTVQVMFVDYGNIETCKASELRKDVCMTHIPIQCHAAQLYGLSPLSEDGAWPVKTLDFIHMTVVEKLCFVRLRTLKTGELLMMSVTGPGNLDLYQLLVSMHYCFLTYTSEDADSDGSDAIYIEAQEDVMVQKTGDSESSEQPAAIEPVGGAIAGDAVLEARPAAVMEAGCEVAGRQQGDVDEGREETATMVKRKEDTESGDSFSSDACDNVEELLPGKSHLLIDWYDIITDEENKLNVSGKKRSVDENDEHMVYRSMELPELDKLLVEVTAMLSVNEIVLHPLKTETVELRTMKTKFEELTKILQTESSTQDVLSDPRIGQPCCACYTEDSQWYRAMIVDIFDDLKVKIVYVDYGNTETVSANCVRKVKAEWLELPVQGLQARLWRVQLDTHHHDNKTVIQQLAECLFKPPLVADIKLRAPLTVQMLCAETLEPVYKSMFEDGLLEFENT